MKTYGLFNSPCGNLARVFLPTTVVVVSILSGCAEMPSGAPIDYRTSKPSDRLNNNTPASTNPNITAGNTTSQTTSQANSQTTGEATQSATVDAENNSVDPKKSPPSEPLPMADAAPVGYYTVKKGDTLLKIAGQFNRVVSELADWNALSNPNAIKAGQVLRVAPPDNPQATAIPVDSDMEVRRAGRPVQSPAAPQVTVRAVPPHKTTPIGQKTKYSDKALAEYERDPPSPVRALDTIKAPTDSQLTSTSPFIWPTEGAIISTFDATRKGIEIAGRMGQPVVAAGDGKVLFAKNMRGYGNLIILEHRDSMVTAYAHNKTILVREGQTVIQRQQIAEMGDSDADSFKLRFEIRHMGKAVDPATLLPPAESQTPPVQ